MAKKKNKLLRWLIFIVIGLVIFGIIGKKAGWIGGADKRQVAAEKAEKRTITETVSASGKIQPEVEVKISPDVSGEIVELTVKEGDEVKKGDLLAKILPDIYQSAVERMVASVNGSRANLANAQSRQAQAESQLEKEKLLYNRNKKLFDDKLISSSDWETIKSAYEVAVAEVDAAKQNVSAAQFNVSSTEASLKETQDQLKKTTIFAPVDGTISKLVVEKGERVVGTTQMAGTAMMSLANLNEMEVNVDVNENDIVRVNNGDTANIEVDAYRGRKFKGIVTEVSNSANIQGNNIDQVTNFTVKVRILRESYQSMRDSLPKGKSVFNPGMSATVDIMTKKVIDVVSVPIGAVTMRDTSEKGKKMEVKGKSSDDMEEDLDKVKVVDDKKTNEKEEKEKKTECVFIIDNGKVKLQPVKVGIQDNNNIEIKAGLDTGEQVVTAPFSAISRMLKDGDPVVIVKKDKLYSEEKK